MEISDEVGSYLVAMARKAIVELVTNHRKFPVLSEVPEQALGNAGVFVTIRNHNASEEVRGCVGVSLPEQSLIAFLLESAISVATKDPRFIPLESRDLQTTRIEVSVLTSPELVNLEKGLHVAERIRIGRDGLIVRWALGSGLLLPQVAIEQGWDCPEFLSQTSVKAGGPPDVWLHPEAEVFRFETSG